jgi:predicted enzyme related to lactoylglutathione lyase
MILFHRDSDDVKDPIPHVIFIVKDMAKTVAAAKAAGGTMTGEPRPFQNLVLGFVTDPAGNRIELIQRP